jgi:anti-sigma regulatory factor (Ser/Thr protein kinase)
VLGLGNLNQLALPVTESNQVGDARRHGSAMAAALGFDEAGASRAGLTVTELATNIVKHGGGGEILLRPLGMNGAAGVELIALDRGPGIADIGASMRDGHSTAGSPGLGLGSILRAAPDLEIYSQEDKGTVLRCELWASGAAPNSGKLQMSAICVPKRGEDVCGDDWAFLANRGRHAMMVVDGLGHGTDAAIAARAAKAIFSRNEMSAEEALDAIHHALLATRGAAAAVAVVQPGRSLLAYAGIGNIVGVIRHAQKGRHLVSHGGILGHRATKIQEFSFPFPANALLIMHTDGLSSHWDLDKYPGLEAKHPGLIAAVLYRDHARARDDVTVAVVRNTMAE